jgi:hypothetical protein
LASGFSPAAKAAALSANVKTNAIIRTLVICCSPFRDRASD